MWGSSCLRCVVLLMTNTISEMARVICRETRPRITCSGKAFSTSLVPLPVWDQGVTVCNGHFCNSFVAQEHKTLLAPHSP